jgi:hypothetical protein
MAPSRKSETSRTMTRRSLSRVSLQVNSSTVNNSNKKTRDLMLIPLIEMLYKKNYLV